jgi:hypothetical protein
MRSLIRISATSLILIWLQGCSGGDPTATDPELIFKDGFENDLAEVELLDDGGTMVRGFSAWLKIAPKLSELRLRRADEYQDVACDALADWFQKATGDRSLSTYRSRLSCQGFTDPRFDFDNGRWRVTDRSTGVVYYRVWKLHDDSPGG